MQRSIIGLLVLLIAAVSLFVFLRSKNSHTSTKADVGVDHQTISPSTNGHIDLSSSRFEEWLEYSSPNKKFHALFPTPPLHTNKVDKDPKTNEVRNLEMYVAEDRDGALYMVYLITFETRDSAKEISESILRDVLDEILVKNPDNKVLNIQKISMHGKSAIDFELTQGDVVAKGRAFTVGNTLYIINVVSKSDNWNPSEYEFFVNSIDAEIEKDNEKNKPLK